MNIVVEAKKYKNLIDQEGKEWVSIIGEDRNGEVVQIVTSQDVASKLRIKIEEILKDSDNIGEKRLVLKFTGAYKVVKNKTEAMFIADSFKMADENIRKEIIFSHDISSILRHSARIYETGNILDAYKFIESSMAKLVNITPPSLGRGKDLPVQMAEEYEKESSPEDIARKKIERRIGKERDKVENSVKEEEKTEEIVKKEIKEEAAPENIVLIEETTTEVVVDESVKKQEKLDHEEHIYGDEAKTVTSQEPARNVKKNPFGQMGKKI